MRRLQGTVISHKTKKTAVVRVDRLVKHEKYQKFYRSSRKFKAHDPEDRSKAGDVVVIEESRPLSKDKRWRIVELISRESDTEGDEGNDKSELS